MHNAECEMRDAGGAMQEGGGCAREKSAREEEEEECRGRGDEMDVSTPGWTMLWCDIGDCDAVRTASGDPGPCSH